MSAEPIEGGRGAGEPMIDVMAGVLAPEGPDGSAGSARTGGPGAGEPMIDVMAGVLAPEGPDGSAGSARTGGPGAGEPMIDVRALAIAIDHGARAAVQSAMRAIAAGGDTATKAGLARMLREASRVVGEARPSWRCAALEGGPRPAGEAERAFRELAQRARARFPVEVIRNAYGTTTSRPAPELPASDEPGLVVVTFVVASRALLTIGADDPRQALAVLGATAESDLVALEVIWSPAEEADRVSEAQVRARHPELRRIAP